MEQLQIAFFPYHEVIRDNANGFEKLLIYIQLNLIATTLFAMKFSLERNKPYFPNAKYHLLLRKLSFFQRILSPMKSPLQ